MILTNSWIFDVAVFNAFIVIITCLKYPLDYQRRVANKRPIARVIDGEDADRIKYAYVVILEYSAGHYLAEFNITVYRLCTGSLINKHFVISAAHCSAADRIRYGDLTVPSTSTKASHSNIIRKIIHVKYENQALPPYPQRIQDSRWFAKNDIALYKVEPVHLSIYGVLSAVDYKTLIGLSVHYVGCGSNVSPEMNKTEKIKGVVEHETRERQIGYAVVKPCGKFPRTVLIYPLICLAQKCNSNQDSNKGDSGGPLLYAGKIVGVCKGNPPVDGLPKTSAYTPISVYLDWIQRVVNTED